MLRCVIVIFWVLMFSSAVGCRGGWSTGVATQPTPVVPTVPPQATAAAVADEAPTPQLDEEAALAEVLDELADIDAIDADAKRLLMADLKQAKRENWPLIVRQFKSALAYRKQLAAREATAADESRSFEETANLVATRQPAPAIDAPAVDVDAPQARAVPVTFETQTTALPTPPQQITTINRNTGPAEVVKSETPPITPSLPVHATQQVNYLRTEKTQHDWQAHLQHTIDDLRTTVQPSPGSTDEVNQHMRLRLLQLLAGSEESALAPIPGATATQQDYWNQQLFAISTFLDAKTQPDDKRRAAGSLLHLDGARAKLAELATLQVQKLAFVDSVEGYGAYETLEEGKFQPGEKVTLYCEVENFSSESTKTGYRTRLGTSYEVVDQNGKRVDSAQFPEIEDLCRNPRRDFHMQYTVTLPKRIYPEQYELRLIITDQQSHKIGQASIPFEITE